MEKALGDVLAYLITGEAAGRVCSLEIMTDEQTGPAEYSMAHVALETGAAIGSHMLATRQGCSLDIMSGDQTGLAEQFDDACRTIDGRCNWRSCSCRRDSMLGGARPDEIRWSGETKSPTACVSVPRSSRRREYFIVLKRTSWGDGFSSVEKEWRSKRFFFFHHVEFV